MNIERLQHAILAYGAAVKESTEYRAIYGGHSHDYIMAHSPGYREVHSRIGKAFAIINEEAGTTLE